ncbi:trigger factor [Nemorincola caseinilytica]|uniref:Trigger factor n=1 Tax=Nemorincola caseinilytica TaxID=2054315 RepID=A0ABP8NF75_9BACT
MATVTRESIGTLHDTITVKLEKGDYMPAFEKSLKQYAKTASIPGFRKGMVPAGMVRKMYGPSVFNDEVIRVASRQLEDYMKNEKIAIFAQPMLLPVNTKLDMNAPTDVDFAFEVGLKPEFDVESVIKGANLDRYKINISDGMIEDELGRIKRRYGKVDEQTEVTAKDNIIYSEYVACDADGNAAADAKKIEDTEELSKMPARLQDMLMGKGPGTSVVIRPVDVCTEEELTAFLKDPLKAGAEAAEQHYKMTLTKVGHLIPAEMDSELFEKVFPNRNVTNAEEFMTNLRNDLGVEFARLTGERLQNEMFELLVHNVQIELPVPFLKRWMREGGEKRRTAEEVDAEFGSFDHQLRWQLISDKLMQENGIEVSLDEIKTDIKVRVLAYFGLTTEQEDEAPWMESYLTKMLKDEKMMDETYRRLLFGKLFAFLETKFAITDKEIGEEQFFQLADAHATHHHHHHAH